MQLRLFSSEQCFVASIWTQWNLQMIIGLASSYKPRDSCMADLKYMVAQKYCGIPKVWVPWENQICGYSGCLSLSSMKYIFLHWFLIIFFRYFDLWVQMMSFVPMCWLWMIADSLALRRQSSITRRPQNCWGGLCGEVLADDCLITPTSSNIHGQQVGRKGSNLCRQQQCYLTAKPSRLQGWAPCLASLCFARGILQSKG